VWIEADRVLYSGDVAMSRPPSFASPHSSLAQWLDSLDRYEALDPAVVVPAHGPLGEGLEFITGYRGYLTTVRERASSMKRDGASLDDAIAAVGAELEEVYGPGRHAGAIRTAYAEAAD
jgi:cyclase